MPNEQDELYVKITKSGVFISGFEVEITKAALQTFSCRTVTHEALGWALQRIGEELQKSAAFYRTGEMTDSIAIG